MSRRAQMSLDEAGRSLFFFLLSLFIRPGIGMHATHHPVALQMDQAEGWIEPWIPSSIRRRSYA